MKEKLLLVCNDDGIFAKGLDVLTDLVKPFGRVIVVAPEQGNSGMSHALTIKVPVRIRKVSEEENIVRYAVNGTPADCIKLAFSQILDRKPDLVVSGVNHGSNSSISVIYSGTMAAVIEACLYGVPAIGFSSVNYAPNQSFELVKAFGQQIINKVLAEGLKEGTSLNVNFPDISPDECKGIAICRQNKGRWVEEYEKRIDPRGRDYYWLTGNYKNDEPESEDTDEWALNHKYISIVPIHVDLTDYEEMESIKNWIF